MGAIILVSILPDCLSVFGVWLGYLSRLAQVYSKMYTTIADVDSLVDSIPACIESFACSDPYPGSDNAPPYSSHACVGTALMAADVSAGWPRPYTILRRSFNLFHSRS